MMMTVFNIIIVPVSLGLAVNHYYGRSLAGIKQWLPLVSVFAIILIIITIIIALAAQQLLQLVLPLIATVILHNSIGFLGGYYLLKYLGFDNKTCRTLTTEVGMQNSGLGVALAAKYFTLLAALPSAFFSIWCNVSGSVLAAYWTRKSQYES